MRNLLQELVEVVARTGIHWLEIGSLIAAVSGPTPRLGVRVAAAAPVTLAGHSFSFGASIRSRHTLSLAGRSLTTRTPPWPTFTSTARSR